MSTLMSSRFGGAWSFGMFDGLTVDGGLLEALLDALSVPFDPPHPAMIRAAAVKIRRVLDVVTVNHCGGAPLSSQCERSRRCDGGPSARRRSPHRRPRS